MPELSANLAAGGLTSVNACKCPTDEECTCGCRVLIDYK